MCFSAHPPASLHRWIVDKNVSYVMKYILFVCKGASRGILAPCDSAQTWCSTKRSRFAASMHQYCNCAEVGPTLQRLASSTFRYVQSFMTRQGGRTKNGVISKRINNKSSMHLWEPPEEAQFNPSIRLKLFFCLKVSLNVIMVSYVREGKVLLRAFV